MRWIFLRCVNVVSYAVLHHMTKTAKNGRSAAGRSASATQLRWPTRWSQRPRHDTGIYAYFCSRIAHASILHRNHGNDARFCFCWGGGGGGCHMGVVLTLAFWNCGLELSVCVCLCFVCVFVFLCVCVCVLPSQRNQSRLWYKYMFSIVMLFCVVL